MASELVTNAVVHGRPPITFRAWRTADRLTVAVGDQDRTPPTCQLPPAHQSHGRGLVIVNALAAHWGVDQSPEDGKRVWFDLATS
jgi:anti-sigma regulatory factor (Ser/Thr protein kinase)